VEIDFCDFNGNVFLFYKETGIFSVLQFSHFSTPLLHLLFECGTSKPHFNADITFEEMQVVVILHANGAV